MFFCPQILLIFAPPRQFCHVFTIGQSLLCLAVAPKWFPALQSVFSVRLPFYRSEMHLLSTLTLAGCLIVSLGRRSVFKELIFCCWQKKGEVKEGSRCGSVLNKLWRSQRILIWFEKETCIQQHLFVCDSLNEQLWLLWEFGVDCMTGINWISLMTRT